MLVLAQACPRARPEGLVDEDDTLRVKLELAVEPRLALAQNVRPVLLAGVRGLFLRVSRWRTRKRWSVP